MRRTRFAWLTIVMLLYAGATPAADDQRPGKRAAALGDICQRLGVGRGAIIADVGCGSGSDTLTFATIVGERGSVLAQEIDAAKLAKVLEVAGQDEFQQVVPVLGESENPRLPNGLVDLVYMHSVFHHLARPQPMLEHIWHDLKPGGFLVVVDQQKGPLKTWVPFEKREKEHHWTGETTVVRMAREAGFAFHEVLDDLWHERAPFVLAFQKPSGNSKPGRDPDLPDPLDPEALLDKLPAQLTNQPSSVLVFALDGGRAVASDVMERLPVSTCLDAIIDEWALTEDELPSGGELPGSRIVRMQKGKLTLPVEFRADLVLFLDAYHRLWEPQALLHTLKEHLSDSASIVVVDRNGPEDEIRRTAGHRRRLASTSVQRDLLEAGFTCQRTEPALPGDRFFLLFGR